MNNLPNRTIRFANHFVTTHNKSHQEAHAHEQVAHAQINNGLLGILESTGLDQKRARRANRAEEA